MAAMFTLGLLTADFAAGQEQKKGPPPGQKRERPPQVVSPEVKDDKTVVFRLLAPKSQSVTLVSSDIPGGFQPRALKKGENGVWELSLKVEPGTYRYTLTADDVRVVDPRNQAVSESNGTVWSVVHVPGAAFMDSADVPHGAVSVVHYKSSALSRDRRMHVYTPPGYETGSGQYPVFYLLHGAGDCDDSWTSVGRANYILDNLIAAGKAKPMIVVMPAGHTGPFSFGGRTTSLGNARFEDDFLKDVVPLVEKRYRVLAGRENRALAGLSMGGGQTLSLATMRPNDFGYVGVFSSGLFVPKTDEWETKNKAALADAAARAGLKLFWFATGKEDFLLKRTQETVELFKKHGFQPLYKETTGGHTWINWQLYLNEFAPLLFK